MCIYVEDLYPTLEKFASYSCEKAGKICILLEDQCARVRVLAFINDSFILFITCTRGFSLFGICLLLCGVFLVLYWR